tara:strand:- start:20731 stop:21033 length:303 start_codon:yes stop_codon:yes gene_type:complete
LKPDKLLLELEQLLEQSGYRLRKERGSFRGNDCLIEGERLVIVNKNKPIEAQISTIARVLADIDLSNTYIKPAIKKDLEVIWDRLSVQRNNSGSELEFED